MTLPFIEGERGNQLFKASDGTSLEVKVLEKQASHNYLVFHNPGLSDFVGYRRFASAMQGKGWNVVLYNPRSIRESEGKYIPQSMISDDIELVKKIRENDSEAYVAGIGSCLGSYVQVMANQQYNGNGSPLYDQLFINGIVENMPALVQPSKFLRLVGWLIKPKKQLGSDGEVNDYIRNMVIKSIHFLNRTQNLGKKGRDRFEEGAGGAPDRLFALNVPKDSYFEFIKGFQDAPIVDYSSQPGGTRIIQLKSSQPAIRSIAKFFKTLKFLYASQVQYAFLSKSQEEKINSQIGK